jgi:hypothetical protein
LYNKLVDYQQVILGFSLTRFLSNTNIIWDMFVTNLRRGLGVVILAIALISLTWGYWPVKRNQRLVEIPGLTFQPTGDITKDGSQSGMLKVAWPAWMQVGSSDRIWVRLAPGQRTEPGLTAAAGESVVSGLPSEISGGAWGVEARLEIPGIMSEPAGVAQGSLNASTPLEFSWNVQALRRGIYPGTIWLHTVMLPTAEKSAASLRLLSVQPVEIRVTTLFGLNAYLAQVVGIVGAVLGTALMIDILFPRLRRLFQSNQVR